MPDEVLGFRVRVLDIEPPTSGDLTLVPVGPLFEADRLLRDVLGLGDGGRYYDHLCQFCGRGPNEPAEVLSEFHPHAPDCRYARIQRHLKVDPPTDG